MESNGQNTLFCTLNDASTGATNFNDYVIFDMDNKNVAEYPVSLEEQVEIPYCDIVSNITHDSVEVTGEGSPTKSSRKRGVLSVLEDVAPANNLKDDHHHLVGIHVTQKHVVGSKNGKAMTSGFGNVIRNNLIASIDWLPKDDVLVKRFQKTLIKNKRSIAKFSSNIKLLAVENLFSSLEADVEYNKLSSKAKSNKFSQFQRDDRGTGERLAKEYAEKRSILETDTLKDLSRKSQRTLIKVNKAGYVDYASSENGPPVVIYETEDALFLVRNIEGFCKV